MRVFPTIYVLKRVFDIITCTYKTQLGILNEFYVKRQLNFDMESNQLAAVT